MKRFILITIALLLGSHNVVFAQFNTVTQNRVQRKTTHKQQTYLYVVPVNDSIKNTTVSGLIKTEQTDRLPAIVSPLRHIVVTSPYGLRTDPFTKKKVRHNGLDLKAYYEPAYAMMYGEVINVDRDKRSGLYVTLRHGDFTISYCHLSRVAVTKGTHVRPGTIIALTGNTGRSTAPHLHLTLKKDGKNINPVILIGLVKQIPMNDLFADNGINAKD